MKKHLFLLKWPYVEILCSIIVLLAMNSCQDQMEATYAYQAKISQSMKMSSVREKAIILKPEGFGKIDPNQMEHLRSTKPVDIIPGQNPCYDQARWSLTDQLFHP